uniref:Uncharacterized protein n=1 Tax=Anguilla anguilla TaxID=7936 RepID=A0A0E9RF61_ANGAN
MNFFLHVYTTVGHHYDFGIQFKLV